MNRQGNLIDATDRFAVPEPSVGWDEHDRIVGEQRAKEVDRETQGIQSKRLHRIGVPRKLHSSILAGLAPKPAVLAMRAFHIAARDGQEHLSVLSGSAGVGKSTAAAAWLLHAAGESMTRPRIRMRKFIAASRYCRISEYDTAALSAIEDACFLVIDDLGTEYGDKRDYHASRLDDLICQRHAEMLPTVITTNLSMEEIKVEYGDRVESRLSEFKITTLRDEPDLRKKPLEAELQP